MNRLIIFFVFICSFFLFAASSFSDDIDELNTAIQAKGAGWIAKETPFSNMPKDERKKWTGAPEGLNLSGAFLDELLYNRSLLPSSFDWTNMGGNYITSVKNQSSCAACGVFTWIAAMESKFLIAHNLPGVELDLSEQIVLSCSSETSCGGGGTLEGIIGFLQNTGTYLETCYPYTATNGNCNQACANWQTNAYKIDGWSYLIVYVYNNMADLSVIKNALYMNGPLPVHMNVYEDFYNYGEGVYTYTSGKFIYTHWVLLVGWDDSKRALKCKNSWGTKWGEGGFFWISYDDLFGISPVAFGRIVLTLGNVLQGTKCTATIDANLLLHIPYISFVNPTSGTTSLWADFVYEYNPMYPTIISFKLTNCEAVNNPSFSCSASILSADMKIHIPDVLLPDGSTHIWVDLEYSTALSTNGNLYWVVTNYGVISN